MTRAVAVYRRRRFVPEGFRDEKEKFGVAVATDLVQQLEEMKDECEDIGASCSEIIEAIIMIYFQADLDHPARVRESIIRRRKGNS